MNFDGAVCEGSLEAAAGGDKCFYGEFTGFLREMGRRDLNRRLAEGTFRHFTMNAFRPVFVVLALLMGGCTPPSPAEKAPTFEPPRDLRARLVNGQHVDLSWTYTATAPGGVFVEFRVRDDEDFTMLEAAWPGRSAYRHPDVAPDTRFVYRVRSFFGRPSDPVSVQSGKKGEADKDQAEGPFDGSGATAPVPPSSSSRPKGFAPEMAPTDVTARLSSGTGVELHWRDRATGEDGYLVEMVEGPATEYRIVALLPPDTTSFRKTALPEQTRCTFRIRAYFYGASSNLAEVLTPTAAEQASLKRVLDGPGTAQ